MTCDKDEITVDGVTYIKKEPEDMAAIRKYIAKHDTNNEGMHQSATIEDDKVLVSLPTCNEDWTYATWDWVKAFCKKFENAFPIHRVGNQNHEYQYIDISSYT